MTKHRARLEPQRPPATAPSFCPLCAGCRTPQALQSSEAEFSTDLFLNLLDRTLPVYINHAVIGIFPKPLDVGHGLLARPSKALADTLLSIVVAPALEQTHDRLFVRNVDYDDGRVFAPVKLHQSRVKRRHLGRRAGKAVYDDVLFVGLEVVHEVERKQRRRDSVRDKPARDQYLVRVPPGKVLMLAH